MLSGVASGVITARDLDAPVSYEGLAKIDSGLGSLGFIVYDDTADMVAVARAVSRFLYVESCGQCPACKFGTGEVTAYLENIATGKGSDRDVEVIGARLETVTDANRCFLGAQEQARLGSFLRSFPKSSPPTSRVRHRRRRSRSRSSSPSATGSRSTTSAKLANGPTGRTTSRWRSIECQRDHAADHDDGDDEERHPPHPGRRATEAHRVGDRLALPVLLGASLVARPDLREMLALPALPTVFLRTLTATG